jgi:hypothetical protein
MKKLIVILATTTVIVSSMFAATVRVGWDLPSSTNGIAGYKIYSLKTNQGAFNMTNSNLILVSTVANTSATNSYISNVVDGFIRFAAVSYNTNGTPSAFSTEASVTITNIPSVPLNFKILSVDVYN